MEIEIKRDQTPRSPPAGAEAASGTSRELGKPHGDSRGALSAHGGDVAGCRPARCPGSVPSAAARAMPRSRAEQPSRSSPGQGPGGWISDPADCTAPSCPLINHGRAARAGVGCSRAHSRFQRQRKAPGCLHPPRHLHRDIF